MPFKTIIGHTQHDYTEHIIVTASMNHTGIVVELCSAIAVFYRRILHLYCIMQHILYTLLNQKSVKSTIFNT